VSVFVAGVAKNELDPWPGLLMVNPLLIAPCGAFFGYWGHGLGFIR